LQAASGDAAASPLAGSLPQLTGTRTHAVPSLPSNSLIGFEGKHLASGRSLSHRSPQNRSPLFLITARARARGASPPQPCGTSRSTWRGRPRGACCARCCRRQVGSDARLFPFLLPTSPAPTCPPPPPSTPHQIQQQPPQTPPLPPPRPPPPSRARPAPPSPARCCCRRRPRCRRCSAAPARFAGPRKNKAARRATRPTRTRSAWGPSCSGGPWRSRAR
jgi:hypothetical protein